MGPRSAPTPSRDFQNLARTQAEEDAFDYRKAREEMDKDAKFTSTFGAIAHIVKGALGGGILSGHVAYMKGGVGVSIPLNVFFGIYMGYCLYLLVGSAQILYRRTRIPAMSYADVGEASAMTHSSKSVQYWARPFRYTIDAIICMDLFGSCCCYQIIIAKSIKQLVEDTPTSEFEGAYEGYPSLRVYLAVMIPFVVAISLIRHLKVLAPFSIGANFVIGMALIIVCLFLASFFGYVAFLEECMSPVTLNFPMTMLPKILKGLIAVMIYVTHALNFWVPFNLCFYYLKKRHRPEKQVFAEYVYRAIFVTIIGLVAIIFPDINAIMGFIGCFCLSNMAFIWPNLITLLVIWNRPGLGAMKWRLWRGAALMGVGLFIFVCGTMVNGMELISVFIKLNINKDEKDTPDVTTTTVAE